MLNHWLCSVPSWRHAESVVTNRAHAWRRCGGDQVGGIDCDGADAAVQERAREAGRRVARGGRCGLLLRGAARKAGVGHCCGRSTKSRCGTLLLAHCEKQVWGTVVGRIAKSRSGTGQQERFSLLDIIPYLRLVPGLGFDLSEWRVGML
eukprot:364471-Chlamydomonas_euryale.AAC.5